MSVIVVDYGLGNLTSVYNALKFLGENAKISQSPKDLKKADRFVLPGVGAFKDAMNGLEKRGLIEALKEALSEGKPYLGICLGLQILFGRSEEGNKKGLGVFKGKVKRFTEKRGIKVPHIGWNKVKFKTGSEKDSIKEKQLYRRKISAHNLEEALKHYSDKNYIPQYLEAPPPETEEERERQKELIEALDRYEAELCKKWDEEECRNEKI